MSDDYQRGPQQSYGWGYGPQPGQGPRRIDVLDVLEGVMQDGLSFSNLSRIARASGSKFWLGAALGAGAVVLARKPEVRAAVSGLFRENKRGV